MCFIWCSPSHLTVRFNYAHNDYLEFLLEFGLVFSGVMAVAVSYWAKMVYPRGSLSLRAGVVGAISAIALHSVVDFNLQIPGSAIFFWIAVGMVMNPNMVEQRIGSSLQEMRAEDTSVSHNRSGFKARKSKKKHKVKNKRQRAWIEKFKSD